MVVAAASTLSTRHLARSLARIALASGGGERVAARALHASAYTAAAGPSRTTGSVGTLDIPSASSSDALDELPWFSQADTPTTGQELVTDVRPQPGLPGSVGGSETAPASDELPWFTQDASDGVPIPQEEVLSVSASEFRDGGVYDRVPRPSILSGMDVPSTEALQYLLPSQLDDLYDILICGPPSHLVAPLPLPPPSGSESAQSTPHRPSIRFIHAPSLSPDRRAKADWVVVVESRTSNPQDVHQLAQQIGRYLAHTPPPETAKEFSEEFQQSLSPPKHTRGDMLGALNDMFKNPVGHYYKGSGRQPDEEHEPKEKTGKAWRPTRMLSRQTQDGMRMLNKADPEMFTVQHLAQAFHVSEVAVRKILRSKWQPSPEEAAKQERRRLKRRQLHREAGPEAHKLVLERLQAALAKQHNLPLSADSSLLGDALLNGYDPESKELVNSIRQTSRRDAMDKIQSRKAETKSKSSKEPRPVQRVEYHGLPSLAGEAAGTGAGAGASAGAGAGTGASLSPHNGRQPDGRWAMLDASWCRVHIVTPDLRPRFHEEQEWEKQAAAVMHQNLDGVPDTVFPEAAPAPEPEPAAELAPKQVAAPTQRARKSSPRPRRAHSKGSQSPRKPRSE